MLINNSYRYRSISAIQTDPVIVYRSKDRRQLIISNIVYIYIVVIKVDLRHLINE